MSSRRLIAAFASGTCAALIPIAFHNVGAVFGHLVIFGAAVNFVCALVPDKKEQS